MYWCSCWRSSDDWRSLLHKVAQLDHKVKCRRRWFTWRHVNSNFSWLWRHTIYSRRSAHNWALANSVDGPVKQNMLIILVNLGAWLTVIVSDLSLVSYVVKRHILLCTAQLIQCVSWVQYVRGRSTRIYTTSVYTVFLSLLFFDGPGKVASHMVVVTWRLTSVCFVEWPDFDMSRAAMPP